MANNIQPETKLADKKILNNPAEQEMYLFLQVKKAEIKQAKNNSEYLDMVVCNKDNTLIVKKFNLADDERLVQPGDVIKIKGKIQMYNGNPQLNISRFRKAGPDEFNMEDLKQQANTPTSTASTDTTPLKDKRILNNPIGMEIIMYLLVKKVDKKEAKNGSVYLDMVVCDKNNIINVKKFDLSEEEASIQPGEIIKIKGTISTYKDEKQLSVSQFRKAAPDEVSMDSLVPAATKSGEEMYAEAMEYIANIEDKKLQKLTKTIYERHKDELLTSAAALHMHHMIRGGLLLHVTTMARAAVSMCLVYDWLDKDMLMTGVLLHDIGKLAELKRDTTGLANDFTRSGKLLGHLELGLLEVHDECLRMGFEDEKRECVEHLITSHHGEYEFGTATIPITPEAQMLHDLDRIDSKLYAYKDALDGIQPGEFSDKVYALKNKNVYKPTFCTT